MSRFSIQIDQWAKRAKQDVRQAGREVALHVLTRVSERTPVDTGRARASWTIAVNSADLRVAPEGFSGGAGAAAKAVAQQAASCPVGDVYVVANSLPYIEPLENGHSKQAPAGMVALTVAEVQVLLEA